MGSCLVLASLLAAGGCVETVAAPRDASAFDVGQVRVLPPTDDHPSFPDAALSDVRPPADDCPATGCTAVSPPTSCPASFLPLRAFGQAEQIYPAVRANGDNTAVFWSAYPDLSAPYVVNMQRFDAMGNAVDAQAIVVAHVPQSAAYAVATGWDHAAGEPIVLLAATPGTATLRRGGIAGEPTEQSITLRDADTGAPLNGAHGLRTTSDGGWTFMSTTTTTPPTVVEVFLTATGDVRATYPLPMNAPVSGLFSVVELLDGSALLLSSAGGGGAIDYQRIDARGEPLGPGGTWRGTDLLPGPPVAPTRTGYLFGRSPAPWTVSLTPFGWEGTALGASQSHTFRSVQSPAGMFAAHGHVFVAVEDIQRLPGQTFLQAATEGGTEGELLPIPRIGYDGPARELQAVPTSLGAMFVFGVIGGPPGYQLTIAPLRVCD